MRSKHILSQDELHLPDLIYRYKVSATGTVVDIQTNETLVPDSTGHVEIEFLGKSLRTTIGWIILMAFKPLYRSKSFSTNWTVAHVDGNHNNNTPKNLVWVPPVEKQPCPELPGFYIVPGLSIYAVNEEGFIYSRLNDQLVRTRWLANGYVCFSVRTDNYGVDHKALSLTTYTLHRALALTFIPVEDWSKIQELQVNHKDKNKQNNCLLNLEWMTNQENTLHSFKAGNRNTCSGKSLKPRPVIGLSIFMNDDGRRDIIRTASRAEMAAKLNVSVDVLAVALSKDAQWPCNNYVCYYEDDYERLEKEGKIREFTKLEVDGLMNKTGIFRPIVVTWLKDGRSQVFKSLNEFSRYVAEDKELCAMLPSGVNYPGYRMTHFGIDYLV